MEILTSHSNKEVDMKSSEGQNISLESETKLIGRYMNVKKAQIKGPKVISFVKEKTIEKPKPMQRLKLRRIQHPIDGFNKIYFSITFTKNKFNIFITY